MAIISLFQFGFQFVGGFLRKHADLRTVFREKILNNFWFKRQRRGEVCTVHIGKDGFAHLTRHDTVIQIRSDIHRCHYQLAPKHIRLYQHTQFTGDMPCVDGLDGRLVVLREVLKVHHLSLVQQLPPIQIAPVIGGEAVSE